MASPPTHVVATAALAAAFYRPLVPWHLWVVGAILAVVPDLDFIGYRLGIPYEDVLGHRGLSHSLFFAAILAAGTVAILFQSGAGTLSRRQVWLFLFLAATSHGVLDAFTNGGLGVAFFAPLTSERYFFPFRPIEVSPLSIQRFLSARGLAIVLNEALWVWLPSLVTGAAILWYRRSAARGVRPN